MKQIISDYLLLLLLGINESSSQSALATDHEVESAAESDQVRGSHADRFIIITRPLEHINIGKIMILRRSCALLCSSIVIQSGTAADASSLLLNLTWMRRCCC